MSVETVLGPGTITISTGTPVDYSGECLGITINHAYSDVGANRTMLDGTLRKARRRRDPDSITIRLEPDLTDVGLYNVLQANDLEEATVTYTPNDAQDTSWTGTVVLQLPENVEGTEFGSAITSQLTLQCTTTFSFTPHDTTP